MEAQSEAILLRVITPQSAHETEGTYDKIPLFNNGQPIPLTTTLRTLKESIANHFGETITHPDLERGSEECNCTLARSIARYGMCDMLRNWKEHGQEDCSQSDVSPCNLCHKSVKDHCASCEKGETDRKSCTYVKNAGCDHLFHHHCYSQCIAEHCPAGCSKDITQREMLPIEPHGRRLVVISGNSVVEVFGLDKDFGGPQNRASISLFDLTTTLQTLLGSQRCESRKWFALNGYEERDKLLFHRSLIISVCAESRHPFFGNKLDTQESGPVSSDPDQKQSIKQESKDEKKDYLQTLDLHTMAAPIARAQGLDMTLKDLRLHEYACDGVLNLFAVFRQLDKSISATFARNSFSKERIFKLHNSWKIPRSAIEQTEKGYACFLASLRAFTSCFSSRAQKDRLLRLVASLMRFPPATRAICLLINRYKPEDEDRSAFAQCFFHLSKDFAPLEVLESHQHRLFELARLVFGYLYGQANIPFRRDQSEDFPYLEQFVTTSLICQITQESVFDPVELEDGTIMEKTLAYEYTKGVLRMTHPISLHLSLDFNGIGLLTWLNNLLVGTFRRVTYFKGNSTGTERYRDGSDETLNPVSSVNLEKICDGLRSTPLAVRAPMDLSDGSRETLTIDASGNLAVFIGYTPCALPPDNVTFFCPTSGGDKDVDTAKVTQELERLREGSEIDYFSKLNSLGHTNSSTQDPPNEIIMICLDSSASMDSSADFRDMQGSQNNVQIKEEAEDELRNPLPTNNVAWSADDVQEHLDKSHLLEDLLGLVHLAGAARIRRRIAFDILTDLALTYRRMASALMDRSMYLRMRDLGLVEFIDAMDDPTVRTGIAEYLVTHSIQRPSFSGHLSMLSRTVTSNTSQIPKDFICPITGFVMKDPAIAKDGVTYERQFLVDWCGFFDLSPVSGLPMAPGHKSDIELSNRIKNWINGSDLDASPNTPRKRHFGFLKNDSSNPWKIKFNYRLDTWTVEIAPTTPTHVLTELALRYLKSKMPTFNGRLSIFLRNSQLVPSPSPISSTEIKNGDILRVEAQFLNEREDNRFVSDGLCLVKVYRHYHERIPAIAYWVPRNSEATLLSVLVRYWHWTETDFYATGHTASQLQVSVPNPDDEDCLKTYYILPSHFALAYTIEKYATPDRMNANSVWDKASAPIDLDNPPFLPCTLKLYLRDYESPSQQKKRHIVKMSRMSRIQTVKQIFDVFINRTLAYHYKHHIGLLTFSSKPLVRRPITHVIEDFRSAVHGVTVSGFTSLWDALALAEENLTNYGKQFPGSTKRIICLSDGEDTKSTYSAQEVCLQLQQNNVVVDSFIIGNAKNHNLRTISYATGGYQFAPKDIDTALGICELESVLSASERPAVEVKEHARSQRIFDELGLASPWDIVSHDRFPQRKGHPLIDDSFLSLTWAAELNSKKAGSQGAQKQAQWIEQGAGRLLFEMRNAIANPHPYYDVYVSERNMGFWKVVMEGPPDSLYAGSAFLMYLDMDPPYPNQGPQARFVTPILHPNITKQGRICHSILDRNWTVDTSSVNVLNSIWALLHVPDLEDSALFQLNEITYFSNVLVTQRFYSDRPALEEFIRNHCSRHAKKSRGEWARELSKTAVYA